MRQNARKWVEMHRLLHRLLHRYFVITKPEPYLLLTAVFYTLVPVQQFIAQVCLRDRTAGPNNTASSLSAEQSLHTGRAEKATEPKPGWRN